MRRIGRAAEQEEGMMENIVEIPKEQLIGTVQKMMSEGYRFVTATCVDNGNETLDVIYHFDKEYELINCRLTVGKDEEIPSISKIYFGAFLVENEMKELFGLKITDIVIDYGGHLLLSDDELDAPMAKRQIVIEKKGEKQNA
ncbi:NADH-quinone oxidoreductase subunit C [Pseudoclostridium thermosuccinogenes]|jgi:NADH:ubiquinone oxidoreductase subunit C|uniref:NADH-quinone oxidoreductase subunit C n=1 Tax=Clostridium thermosuccinogenes TaxID=84032 RepID=UPI002FD8B046